MKKRSHFLIFFGASLVFSMNAAAKSSGDPTQILARADANGDGVISWEEVLDMRRNAFSRLDRNGDGYADAEDRPRGPLGSRYTEKLSELIPQFDTDRDGRISQAEFIDAPSPAFEAGDTNNDGTLSADELTRLRSLQAAMKTQEQ